MDTAIDKKRGPTLIRIRWHLSRHSTKQLPLTLRCLWFLLPPPNSTLLTTPLLRPSRRNPPLRRLRLYPPLPILRTQRLLLRRTKPLLELTLLLLLELTLLLINHQFYVILRLTPMHSGVSVPYRRRPFTNVLGILD